ncbi:MAG: hypothetical protein ACI4CS_11890, partial [Candidatus Weimeria sp.]
MAKSEKEKEAYPSGGFIPGPSGLTPAAGTDIDSMMRSMSAGGYTPSPHGTITETPDRKRVHTAEDVIHRLMDEDNVIRSFIKWDRMHDRSLLREWETRFLDSPTTPYLCGAYGHVDEAFSLYDAVNNYAVKDGQTTYNHILRSGAAYRTLDEWCQTKISFVFTDEMEDALMTQDIADDLTVSFLDRLPYRQFGIILSLKQFRLIRGIKPSSVLISVSDYKGERYFSLVVFSNTSDGASNIDNNLATILANEYRIDNVRDRTIKDFAEEIMQNSYVDDPNGVNVTKEFMTFFFNALLYLCADNAELNEKPFEGRPYRPAKPGCVKNIPREVCRIDVGEQFSIHMKQWKAARKNYENVPHQAGTGSPVPPHVRRAHWHHYWKGSESAGDRRLALEWVEPVIVHKELLPMIDASVSVVKDEKRTGKQCHLPITVPMDTVLKAEKEQDELLLKDLENISQEEASGRKKDFHYRGLTGKKIEYVEKNGIKTVRRNRKTSLNALEKADYLCESDPAHETFVRSGSGTPYMEPHHLIPLA